MAPQYKKGQSVRYKPVGGPDSNTSESVGVIRDVLTEPGRQADRFITATVQRSSSATLIAFLLLLNLQSR
ncbi:DUF2945 domain-containing protein [Pectobacterium atrosepticum]|nr:DUF2945 domain-containing protein [Pectobacterium atrosepticum]